jgi:hypothetical protein
MIEKVEMTSKGIKNGYTESGAQSSSKLRSSRGVGRGGGTPVPPVLRVFSTSFHEM